MLLACVWGEMWSLNWTMTRVTNGGLIKDDGAVRLEVDSVLSYLFSVLRRHPLDTLVTSNRLSLKPDRKSTRLNSSH